MIDWVWRLGPRAIDDQGRILLSRVVRTMSYDGGVNMTIKRGGGVRREAVTTISYDALDRT